MQLDELTRPDLIFADLPGTDAPTVLRALAERAQVLGVVDDADELYRRLFEREQLGSTGLGDGVAVPHCKMDGLDRVVMAVGMATQGVDFAAADGQPVRLFFLIISPSDNATAHLQALASISRWLQEDNHARQVVDLESRQDIYELICSKTAATSP